MAIATLTWLNVQHRRQEIGLLRTVGIRTWKIASLFLGKALLYSLLGAALGYGLGELGARALESSVTEWNLALLEYVILGAPAVALLFGSLPILHGLLLDPVEVLREQ